MVVVVLAAAAAVVVVAAAVVVVVVVVVAAAVVVEPLVTSLPHGLQTVELRPLLAYQAVAQALLFRVRP